MTRKEFLKFLNLGFYGIFFGFWNSNKRIPEDIISQDIRTWIWYKPWGKTSEDDFKRIFEKIKLAGIDAVIPNIYDSWRASYKSGHLPFSETLLEKLLPIAKSMELEVHAWMWTMICNVNHILEKHPDWFAINGKGESTIVNPAYVNYYRFMCPNHPDVREFVTKIVSELSSFSDLNGIHFDYIRYPDVILAKKLQKKYDIVQDREYPEYDYCYCERCVSKFKGMTGIDIKKEQYPEKNSEWHKFRYNSLTEMVNNSLIPPAKKAGKLTTAAVFPNWENVRQQWSKWNLDAVFPMLYHNFYDEGIEWIANNTKRGKESLKISTKLYSGLFIEALDKGELIAAIKKSIQEKADGVSLFGLHSMKEDHWEALSIINNE